MRVNIFRDESVILESSNAHIVGAAKFSLFGMLIMFVLDATHPLASLECVRHESRPRPGDDAKGRHGEDNDCELFVRRRFDPSDQQKDVSHSNVQGMAAVRAACIRLLGFSEYSFSFEIDTVVAVAFESSSTHIAPQVPSSTLRERHHHYHNHHLHPEPEAPGVRLLLRDPWKKNFTFFDFKASERDAAQVLCRDIEGYLARAADVAASPAPVHLSVRYDTSRWEEALGWLLFAAFLVLAWVPSSEVVGIARSRHGSRFGTVEIRRYNLLRWTRLQLAVTLDAVSHLSVVEDVSYTLRMSANSPHRALVERREYSLHLFLRSAAIPVATLRRFLNANTGGGLNCTKRGWLGDCAGAGIDMEHLVGQQHTIEFPLGFGQRQHDPALLRRAAEAVSALLLESQSSSSSLSSLSNNALDTCNSRRNSSSHTPPPASQWSDSLLTTTPPAGFSCSEVSAVGGTASIQSLSNTTSDANDNGEDQLNQRQQNAGRCVVCLQAQARVVFFPCKHLKVCSVCAAECASCPICRSSIDERHVVFI